MTLPPPPPTVFEVLRERNGLYQLGRRLCIYLNQPNPFSPRPCRAMPSHPIPATAFTVRVRVRAMYRNPDLMAAAKALASTQWSAKEKSRNGG